MATAELALPRRASPALSGPINLGSYPFFGIFAVTLVFNLFACHAIGHGLVEHPRKSVLVVLVAARPSKLLPYAIRRLSRD